MESLLISESAKKCLDNVGTKVYLHRMGRRDNVVQIRMDDVELGRIIALATSAGLTVSSYVRMRIFGGSFAGEPVVLADALTAHRPDRERGTQSGVKIQDVDAKERLLSTVGREPRRAGYGKGATLGGRESHQRVADVATCGNAPPAEMQARPIPTKPAHAPTCKCDSCKAEKEHK